jgi:hypothetical protein
MPSAARVLVRLCAFSSAWREHAADSYGALAHRSMAPNLTTYPATAQVPTFLFYRSGRLVGRHVGSSRADLIGQILTQQNAAGVAPPPPPTSAARPRRRIVRSV